MKASEIMTRDVVTVSPETSVSYAAAMMVDLRISGFPVVDADGRMVGILTEGDLLHRKEAGTEKPKRSQLMSFLMGDGPSASDYIAAHSGQVGDLMTRSVFSVSEDAALPQIVHLMERHRIRRVPVLKELKLVGLVSRLDIVRILANALGRTGPLDDAEIEQRLRRELDSQPWLAPDSISVAVHDKVVTLEGFIYDKKCRQALHVAAKSVAEGVKVQDKLFWADPGTGILVTA